MLQSKQSNIKTERGTATAVGAHRTRAEISYGHLLKVLEDLGYSRHPAPGSHVLLTHPKTKVNLVLPWRRDSESVDRSRLNGVYQLVESGGIASRQTLQNALQGFEIQAARNNGSASHRPAVSKKKHMFGPPRSGGKEGGTRR